jgi:hypothetical protein
MVVSGTTARLCGSRTMMMMNRLALMIMMMVMIVMRK